MFCIDVTSYNLHHVLPVSLTLMLCIDVTSYNLHHVLPISLSLMLCIDVTSYIMFSPSHFLMINIRLC